MTCSRYQTPGQKLSTARSAAVASFVEQLNTQQNGGRVREVAWQLSTALGATAEGVRAG